MIWGKIGTEGRTGEKTFASAEDCDKEVGKLINEKLRKGYREISGPENIPTKSIREYKPMDENVFWEIISTFNWKKKEETMRQC